MIVRLAHAPNPLAFEATVSLCRRHYEAGDSGGRGTLGEVLDAQDSACDVCHERREGAAGRARSIQEDEDAEWERTYRS